MSSINRGIRFSALLSTESVGHSQAPVDWSSLPLSLAFKSDDEHHALQRNRRIIVNSQDTFHIPSGPMEYPSLHTAPDCIAYSLQKQVFTMLAAYDHTYG